MKKYAAIVSSYLGRVGFYFLLTILLFSFVALATYSTTFNLVLVWTSLLFALLLGLADGIFAIKGKVSYALKLCLYTLIAIAAFSVSFVLISGVIESGKSAVWSIFLFAIFMVVVSGVRGAIYAVMAKKENEGKSYDYLYTAKK